MEAIDHLAQDLQDAIDPWVRQLKDQRLGALFDDITGEGDNKASLVVLEALNQHLFKVEFLGPDRSILGESKLSKELTKRLQVLLNLAHST